MANVDLSQMAISIVVLGIVASIGATVLLGVRDTNTANDAAYNLSNDAALGLGEYGDWFNILVIVSVAAVIIGLIMMAFRPSGGQAIGSQLY